MKMPSERTYSFADRVLANIDQGLRTVFGRPLDTGRPDPAESAPADDLSEAEQRQSARLMRVNHCGEVCAQALYQGQALSARSDGVRQAMQRAASEENDHLLWCRERIHALGSHTSYLNPLFYLGSLALGAAAGAAGDRWSLGFLAETEHQVVRHLEGHLGKLPGADARSRAVIEQMKRDEAEHADTALSAGGQRPPQPIPALMRVASKVMTKTTYWI